MRRLAALILMVALLYIPFATPGCGGQHVDANAALERGDFPTAYRIFKEMANHGEAAGQNGLGFMYVVGQGVPQDYAEGANRFRKAAEHGYVEAQLNLGASYYKGEGVQKDYTLAYYWLSLAVRRIEDKNENIVEARDMATKNLKPEQLEKVDQMVKESKPKKEGE